MVDVLSHGEITRRYNEGVVDGDRVDITHDGYEAHLALYKDGDRQTWLLTGYEKTTDATSEVSGSTGATLSEPNPRVNGEGAADVDDNLPSAAEVFKQLGANQEKRVLLYFAFMVTMTVFIWLF
jgi:hypothetical protein